MHTKNFFKTIDTVYCDTAKNAFLDVLFFLNNKEGFALGDPKNGKITWLVSTNDGKTWRGQSEKVKLQVKKGEAAFAAASIATRKPSVDRAAEGTQSQIFHSCNKGKTWKKHITPI